MILQEGKKVYFASDNHLGAPNRKASLPREKQFVAWLDAIKADAGAIFLMGDLFDFWFEYKTVVPKGFTRTLGKLAELTDSGIPVFYFVGNHDLWMNGYFEEELNIPVYHRPQHFSINDTSFFIGHGDGLGPDDKGFKRMKKVFTNRLAQWLFRWLHPDLGVRLAQHLSVNNRIISGEADAKFLGEDKEWLVLYAKRKLEQQHHDHFIFGHRHLPLEIKISETSTYTNLGDWISYFTYAVFDGNTLALKKWED
ncbi:UDP-2,3-diacylglucosamine diphosphatase [Flagellimonas allohymeniacidonis]|uniref:UDP-2,3-diacylglucosamine diphosphatase n=1 Tax=Flagellimonas allohymeniacidonis TaxID=2517819 RepID=A0A4Q8QCQ9_9FLAO|nr:UDP-2,3-diacylglucosamine diphosphatase [Allomuricauda hymeniacidonis]